MLPHETRVLRFLAGHLLAGVAAAAVFQAALLAADVAGIRTMMFAAPEGWLVAGLLFFGLAITFGSLAMGVAIMLERDAPAPRGPGRFRRLLRLPATSPGSLPRTRPAYAAAGRSKGRSPRIS